MTADAARRKRLLAWYDRHARALPWRRSRDPYAIWISEVMLQQTTVAAVIPRWERFLRRFPDVGALAGASEQELLEEWAGLGYYRRVRDLHRAARQLAASGGDLPTTADELARLPGFGPYTAAAVASIAFGERVAVVDGNVIRVVSRLLGLPGRARDPGLRNRAQDVTEQWISARRPGDFNQAMMELGATVCRPLAPACAACPLRADCRAFRSGRPERYPAPARRRPRESLELIAAVHIDRGRVLLRRRQGQPFLDGLLELPSLAADGDGGERELSRLLRHLGVRRGQVGARLASVRQAITHRDVTVHVHRASGRFDPKATGAGEEARLVALEAVRLPSLFRKALLAALDLDAA